MAVVIITPPATEPVSVAEARAHLRVDSSDDDALIARLIKAGREWVESRSGLALISRRVRETLIMAQPAHAPLAMEPATVLNSVRWQGRDGVWTTCSSQSMALVRGSNGFFVQWSVSPPPSGSLVEADYQCGFSDQPEGAPAALRQAILVWVGAAYAQREGDNAVPAAIDALLQPFMEVRL